MKNKNNMLKFHIFSIIFTAILGIILHFTYQLSNKNLIVGIFSAVNESVWEHLKLIFFPMFLSTIIGYFYVGKNIQNYLCAKTFGIILSILFIIFFFYTYTWILGTNYLILDISSFFISIILGELISYKISLSNLGCTKKCYIIVLIILFFSFILFTFIPPNAELFKDPITSTFGILGGYK